MLKIIAIAAAIVGMQLVGICEAYQKPASVSEEQWIDLQPFVLPDDHPIKESLDKMFAKKRLISSLETLQKAKFFCHKNEWSDIIVAKHQKLKGYVLKIFTEDQPGDEITNFMRRITGAEVIRGVIEGFGYQNHFKVPHKWLYPMVDAQNPGAYPKRFILVSEDMSLVSAAANQSHWKSEKISKSFIQEVFTVLYQGGLKDSVYLDNIPFSTDGKIAFIDTEHVHKWPIRFDILGSNLSKSNQKYLLKLVQSTN